MKKALVGLCMVLMSTLAWALPSEQQVQDAVRQGNYSQAESMMAEVVGEKPNNAKAHYVYAELLAHNGNFGRASSEAAKARQLDPNVGFTDPAKFKSFEDTLRREQDNTSSRSRATPTGGVANTVPMSAPAAGGGIPSWIWLVVLVVVGMFIWRGFQRSRAASGAALTGQQGYGGGPGYNGPGAPMGGTPYGPYGPGGAPVQQPGRGILGTGLAVGAGVAGGMLLDEMLHKRSDGGSGGFIPDANAASDSAARDLQDRQVDFGSGNDWDSGGGGGGGIDLGGGGGGDGGNWE